MSVQKLEIVRKARKDQGRCGRCGKPLPAGSAYQYWYPGFRSTQKIVRCMDCTPRPSERESSLASSLLAAQESFEDNVDNLESVEDIEAAVQEVAEACQELATEYESALDGWENGNEQLQEKVDHYTDQSNEIDGWSWEGADQPDLCEDHEDEDCPACQEKREEWIEEVREAAREVVNSIETL